MLVLSRRLSQKIIFPGMDTAVQVVSIKPGVVRLGIEAPDDVEVVREELIERDRAAGVKPQPSVSLRQFRHQVANRVNSVSIGLALINRQLAAGMTGAVRETLGKMEHETQALREEIEATRQQQPAPFARRRALLVEDDQNERELLAGFLRLAGYDVVMAGDGEEALASLRNQGRPDVMLLDMMLPRFDGASTLHAIRQEPAYQGLKVFAVSGHSPAECNLSGGDAVDRWFAKPVNPELLLQQLDQALRVPEATAVLAG